MFHSDQIFYSFKNPYNLTAYFFNSTYYVINICIRLLFLGFVIASGTTSFYLKTRIEMCDYQLVLDRTDKIKTETPNELNLTVILYEVLIIWYIPKKEAP